jgi:probable rRNA maturation factor
MKVEFINQSETRIPRRFLTQFLKGVARHLQRRLKSQRQIHQLKKELVVVFVPEVEAQRLNMRYRGKNYATDVLSFASTGSESMGELVLCPTVLAIQAREIDWSLRNEMAYMCLHGVLHLLGFDHEKSESQAQRMFDLQDDVFYRELVKCLRSGAKV